MGTAVYISISSNIDLIFGAMIRVWLFLAKIRINVSLTETQAVRQLHGCNNQTIGEVISAKTNTNVSEHDWEISMDVTGQIFDIGQYWCI